MKEIQINQPGWLTQKRQVNDKIALALRGEACQSVAPGYGDETYSYLRRDTDDEVVRQSHQVQATPRKDSNLEVGFLRLHSRLSNSIDESEVNLAHEDDNSFVSVSQSQSCQEDNCLQFDSPRGQAG